MRKKLTAILLALILTVSLLPIPAMAVSETEEAQILAAVSKVLSDYAAQVYRPGADEDAFWDFGNHGLTGRGKPMQVKESDAIIASAFNTALLQDALPRAITAAIMTQQKINLPQLRAFGGLSWHTYGLQYSYHADLQADEDYSDYMGVLLSTMMVHGNSMYPGPTNENDDMMVIIAGSMRTNFLLTPTQVGKDTIVYTVDLDIGDVFDFDDNDNTELKDKGYDTSTDRDLNKLGQMLTVLGLDTFEWSFQKTFTVEVPNACDHNAGAAYCWTLDPDTMTVSSHSGDGYTQNTVAHRKEYVKSSDTTRHYYRMADAVFLRHDAPWVMEYDMTGLHTLILSPRRASYCTLPYFCQAGRYNAWFNQYELHHKGETDIDHIDNTMHSAGVTTTDQFTYYPQHTYTVRLENKPENGSNTVYYSIYDHNLGETVYGPEAMTEYWVQRKGETRVDTGETTDLLSGTDFIINYIGNTNAGVPNTDLELRIWENSTVTETLSYKAPTCTEAGGSVHNCVDCGYAYITEIEPALGHSYTDYASDGNADCTTDGTKTHSCTLCGIVETIPDPGSALGHSFTDYALDGNTTCTTDGTMTRSCTTCGITETIPAEGAATGHRHEATVTAPTCTEQGYTTYTCHCGDTYVDDYTAPTGHKEVILPAIPSTCVEKGKTEGKQCETCGEITVAQTSTAYSNHTWDAGTVVTQPTATQAGTLMYSCIHCTQKSYMSITELPKNGFDDVPADAYYADAVAWAKANGITSGLSETIFGSDMSCTRGQVVTFLWAAAGRPEPKSADNPFTDVTESDYFYKPVLWAVENGITGGIGDGLFGPHETCTRGQIVTFLWASQGKPQSGSSTFTDVLDTDWYAKSVVWAAENQVTGGIGNNQFGPNNTCTRAQVVTFLYKVYG